jgi:glutathione S-transferase
MGKSQARRRTRLAAERPEMLTIEVASRVERARTFQLDLAPYPTLVRIQEACLALPAFADAMPAKQPDADPV